ncbi:MAG TPA: hypothetical protein DCS93_30580 [Microscillaceae bacterium]|nr:hypothetical protein [Microscillaceae bacterium]
MLNPEYRWLSKNDYEIVKKTCLEEVFPEFGKKNSRGPEGAFDRMLVMRRVNFNLSVGAFYNDQMIGFALMGTGIFKDKMSIHDCGIGTIPTYRNQGVSSGILRHFIDQFPTKSKIKYSFISVKPRRLKDSIGRICEKVGYIYGGDLHSYKLTSKKAFTPINSQKFDIRKVHKPNWPIYHQWQRSFAAWERTQEAITINAPYEVFLEAYHQNNSVGFLIGDPRYGKISQIGVQPAYEKEAVFFELIEHFHKIAPHKYLRMLNISTQEIYLIETLQKLGFKKIIELEELKLSF